jgi:hypothetical protein|tara:strand:+ start:5596 stop:6066 length:471 start_codon:yes stop_codon:yes gene_type:complete
MATLTLTLKEELELNGRERGSEMVLSIGSVTEAYHRIITCPANNDTTIATFQTAVHTSDNAIDLEDAKYIRVTNLDAANPVVLSLQISNDEDGAADASTSISLAAGMSYIMGSPHETIACDDDSAAIITDAALHDLESILVDPLGNAVVVEVFILS